MQENTKMLCGQSVTIVTTKEEETRRIHVSLMMALVVIARMVVRNERTMSPTITTEIGTSSEYRYSCVESTSPCEDSARNKRQGVPVLQFVAVTPDDDWTNHFHPDDTITSVVTVDIITTMVQRPITTIFTLRSPTIRNELFTGKPSATSA